MVKEGIIPRVSFSLASVKETLPAIYYFLDRKGSFDWSWVIYQRYPILKKRLEKAADYKIGKKIIDDFFNDLFKQKKSGLIKLQRFFQKEWNKINNSVFLALSEIVEKRWAKKDKKINAKISLNPICPRYLKRRAFDIHYKQNLNVMKDTVIHECFHFIYFEKWKEVFPKTNKREFESPHLVWHLSEMMIGLVLNDSRIQKIFNNKFHTYREYEKIKINGKKLLSYLKDFYNSKRDFSDFLIKSFAFIKRHKNKII